jgi:NitT/TauT family transport system substrate-binding protein
MAAVESTAAALRAMRWNDRLQCFSQAMLLALLWLALGIASGAQPEQRTITIAVGGKAALYYLPLSLAERLGYFRDEGLAVEILDFAGGAKALQAMVGGSADVVSGGFDHTIVMQARGQKLTAFVLQGTTPAISLGVTTAKAAAWTGPRSLRGMKVGVTAPGSSTHMFVNSLLARGGLAPEDVAIIGVGVGPSAIAAVRAGHVDAIASIEPVITLLERSNSIVVKVETVSEKGSRELFGGPLPSGCLYAKASFLRERPNTTQALTNAMVRALRWLAQAKPDEVIRTVPEDYLLGDRAIYLAAFLKQRESYSTSGRIPREGASAMYEMLRGFEPAVRAAGAIELEDTYTNRFVDAVPTAPR